MKLLVSADTLTLCEHLLQRYEGLIMDGVLGAEPNFKACVIESLAEIRSVRHKSIANISERMEEITPEAWKESYLK